MRKMPVMLSLLALAAVAPLAPPAAAQARTVILVRHAEKEAEPRNDPPLTAPGAGRALALAAVLADAGVGSVIVTPTTRTRATGAPTAAAAGVTVIEVGLAGGVAAHLNAVAAAVRERPAGETVLVVGHSNTIPGIVRALGGPAMADLCDPEYAHLFVLMIPADGPPRLVRATYGAPDAPDAASCRQVN